MWHKQPCREGTHIFLVVTFFRVSYWYSEKDTTNDSFAQIVSTRSVNSSKKINLSDPRVNFEIKKHCINFFHNFSRFSSSFFWIMSRLFREIYEDRFWKLEICSNFVKIFQKLAPHVFQQEMSRWFRDRYLRHLRLLLLSSQLKNAIAKNAVEYNNHSANAVARNFPCRTRPRPTLLVALRKIPWSFLLYMS